MIKKHKAKSLLIRKVHKHTPSKNKNKDTNWQLPIRPQTNHNFHFFDNLD